MNQESPRPTHVPGTSKGEEPVGQKGHEAGRQEKRGFYGSARDATGLNARERAPIDPKMPEMPPA
jgi:hypothetical protein